MLSCFRVLCLSLSWTLAAGCASGPAGQAEPGPPPIPAELGEEAWSALPPPQFTPADFREGSGAACFDRASQPYTSVVNGLEVAALDPDRVHITLSMTFMDLAHPGGWGDVFIPFFNAYSTRILPGYDFVAAG